MPRRLTTAFLARAASASASALGARRSGSARVLSAALAASAPAAAAAAAAAAPARPTASAGFAAAALVRSSPRWATDRSSEALAPASSPPQPRCGARGLAKRARKGKGKDKQHASAEELQPSGADGADGGDEHDEVDPVDALKASLAATAERLGNELAQLRTGRAHPGMLEHIRVVAYEGTPPAPISHAAAVSVRDARTLLVTVYDASTSAAVEAAILASPLGLTPQRGESDIVVPVPELTPQQRQEMAKLAKKAMEGAKERVRRNRQKAFERTRAALKDDSKDELKRAEADMQKLVDKANKELAALAAAKEQELIDSA